MPYRIADVTARLIELGIRVDCEACGSDIGWTVPEDQGTGYVQELSMLAEGSVLRLGSTRVITFIPMICQRCGHTRNFLANSLMKGEKIE